MIRRRRIDGAGAEMTILRVLAIVAAMLLSAGGASSQDLTAYLQNAPAVFKVFARYGEGSGFLVDESGFVVTNSHVTAGTQDVTVRVSDSVKVRGRVVVTDPMMDLAIIRISPNAVRHIVPVQLSPQGLGASRVGDAIATLGYPLNRGPVLTVGMVSFIGERIAIADLNINPGSSGGPIMTPSGEAIGVSTFRLVPDGGAGLAGAVSGASIDSLLAIARQEATTGAQPSDDHLPVMPQSPYPWEALIEAATAEEWPDELYNVSDESVSRNFSVELLTPPFIYRNNLNSGSQTTEVNDLRQYHLELGRYPPVVILRVTPNVGQSRGAFWANLIGAAGAVAAGTGFAPVYAPEFKGDIESVTVQLSICPPGAGACVSRRIEPILERFSRIRFEGRSVEAAYLMIPFQAFAPIEGRSPRMLIDVDNRLDDQAIPWSVPEVTVAQIWSDFAAMRDGLK